MKSTSETASKRLIRLLSSLEYIGVRSHTLFEDWVALSEASLRALPRHLQGAHKGEPIADDEETAKLFEKAGIRYGTYWPKVQEVFAQCFAIVLDEMAEPPYEDVVGNVYMLYAYPNPSAGQYFTPTHICRFMAQMIVGDGAGQVLDRLLAAVERTPDHILYPLARAAVRVCGQQPENAPVSQLVRWALPLALENGFEPFGVMDPCCGSGAMFLAAAEQFPPWAVQLGLVQFYGMDIDPTCVAMANLNMMLIGANQYTVLCLAALGGVELARLPLPPRYKEVAAEAKDALERDDHETVRALSRMAHASSKAGGQEAPASKRRGKKGAAAVAPPLGLFEWQQTGQRGD